MILVDPKRDELTAYEGDSAPHHADHHQPQEGGRGAAMGRAARWTSAMTTWPTSGSSCIDDFNKAVRTGKVTPLPGSERVITPYPYLLIIVDELADLQPGGRAPGCRRVDRPDHPVGAGGRHHLVLATRRPSVDVVHRASSRPTCLGWRSPPRPWPIAGSCSTSPAPKLVEGQGGLERTDGDLQADACPGCLGDPSRRSTVSSRPITCSCSRNIARTSLFRWPPAVRSRRTSATAPGAAAGNGELVVTTQFGMAIDDAAAQVAGRLRQGRSAHGSAGVRGIVGPSEGSKAREVLVKPDDLPTTLALLRGEDVPAETWVPEGVRGLGWTATAATRHTCWGGDAHTKARAGRTLSSDPLAGSDDVPGWDPRTRRRRLGTHRLRD